MKNLTALLGVCTLVAADLTQADEKHVLQRQAAANEMIWPSAPPRKEFRYPGGDAWLDSEGSFSANIEVSHPSLFCAQYETRIRFGRGAHGCIGVEWITPLHPLTKRQQCNQVTLVHNGTATITGWQEHYPQISCLELQVQCKGNAC